MRRAGRHRSGPRLALGVAAIVVALDQAAKFYFLALLGAEGRRTIEVLPFLNLVPVWNYGISFGMLNPGSDSAKWVFVALALAIVLGLLVWLRRIEPAWVKVALGLVIGGALGNVIDRLRFGGVFDFLDFHAFGWHWPAFNLADSAITLGVAILLIDALFGAKQALK
ncbi:MAG: signal peptidase II [Pseudomonadota bacterium]